MLPLDFKATDKYKKYFTFIFIVKHVQLFEGNGSNIAGLITTFINVWLQFALLKSSILFNRKLANSSKYHTSLSFAFVIFKMFIVVTWLSLYSSFFFVYFFLLLLLFSAPLPLTKKTIILSKYHSNMTLIQNYLIAVSIGNKNIDFSLCIVALYVKAFWTIS